MKEIAAVYAIFGSAEEAQRIGRTMVERRLAACVNILGSCRSIYRWHGTIEETDEVAVIFKTTRDLAPKLIDSIREAHSYETPAVVALPLEAANPAYQAWIIAETR